MVLNRYVSALTLRFKSVYIGFFESISVFDFELEYADMNFDLVSAPSALRLRSVISVDSFGFRTLIWYRLHNGISKAFRSCVSNGDFIVINLICLFTFDFDLCIEISTTFIIMLMLIMSSRAVMMFILAFLLFGDVARLFLLMEQGIVLGPYILIQLLLYRRKEVKDNLS
ncbi:hypothetical protein RIR_jg22386.t1 [Rhizophagus irregularis DAOM 181602=DAOM 197198]|nr:hypothetical protein RIR_jg22386.t1 [Rhizophagus irregularis DAOM 181602=DAOM 197198]